LRTLSGPEGCSGKLIETNNGDYVLEGEFNPDKIPEGGYRESIWIAAEDDIGSELLRFDVEVAAVVHGRFAWEPREINLGMTDDRRQKEFRVWTKEGEMPSGVNFRSDDKRIRIERQATDGKEWNCAVILQTSQDKIASAMQDGFACRIEAIAPDGQCLLRIPVICSL
jgi:hypothetical protein